MLASYAIESKFLLETARQVAGMLVGSKSVTLHLTRPVQRRSNVHLIQFHYHYITYTYLIH